MLTLDIANLSLTIKFKGHYAMRTFAREFDCSQFKLIFNFDHKSSSIFKLNFTINQWLEIAIYNRYFFTWLHDNNMILTGVEYDEDDMNDIYSLCIKEGDLMVAKLMYYHNTLYNITKCSLGEALKENNLARIKWVYNNISTDLPINENFNGDIDIAEWLHTIFPYDPLDIKAAINYNELLYVMWYCDTYSQQHQSYLELIKYAILNDRLTICIWLYDTYNLVEHIDEIIEYTIGEMDGSTQILIWLAINFPQKIQNYIECDYSAIVAEYKRRKIL